MEVTIIDKAFHEIHNEELRKATLDIYKIGNGIRQSFYRIAAIMNNIDEQKMYVDDGFKDCIDYATTVFNMKKSDAYNLLKIGAEYTHKNGHESNLPHDNKDYSKAQVVALLPLGRGTAYDLTTAGTITPEMTVRQIKEVVKNNKAANAIISGEAYEDSTSRDADPGEDGVIWSVTCYNNRAECSGAVPDGVAVAITEYLEGNADATV